MGKLPELKTDKEVQEFWAKNSTADFWDEFEDEKIEVNPELAKHILGRKKHKKQLTIRLEDSQINAAKAIAEKKGIGYQTLLRMWIVQGIDQEKNKIAG